MRPVLARSIRPARASTSRCLITAGSETSKRPAICVTASSLSCASRSRIARRVGSASAANARSSWTSPKSTIWLSIVLRDAAVKTAYFTIACTRRQGVSPGAPPRAGHHHVGLHGAPYVLTGRGLRYGHRCTPPGERSLSFWRLARAKSRRPHRVPTILDFLSRHLNRGAPSRPLIHLGILTGILRLQIPPATPAKSNT